LKPGMSRVRSCASVLVVSQRKPNWVEAFHGAFMARLRAPWPAMGKLVREGRDGEGEEQGVRLSVEEEEGCTMREHAAWRGARPLCFL
jgi:hypothetical protein